MRSDESRRTRKVCSAHCLNVPLTPVMPRPSTMSFVRRNGTFSGMRNFCPYQCQMCPKSQTYLLEDNAKVDMDEFTTVLVDENV